MEKESPQRDTTKCFPLLKKFARRRVRFRKLERRYGGSSGALLLGARHAARRAAQL